MEHDDGQIQRVASNPYARSFLEEGIVEETRKSEVALDHQKKVEELREKHLHDELEHARELREHEGQMKTV